jgi:hypothetical protein
VPLLLNSLPVYLVRTSPVPFSRCNSRYQLLGRYTNILRKIAKSLINSLGHKWRDSILGWDLFWCLVYCNLHHRTTLGVRIRQMGTETCYCACSVYISLLYACIRLLARPYSYCDLEWPPRFRGWGHSCASVSILYFVVIYDSRSKIVD